MNTPWFQKITLAVLKQWLFLLAGLMWSAVGVMLCWLACGWLQATNRNTMLAMGSIGLILATMIYPFGFSALAKRNIRRINRFPKKRVCIFAFQSWTSYPLVGFMISLGVFLRTSQWIPKPYLAAMYIGIGSSLFLASLHYYGTLLTQRQSEANPRRF